ncbi:O-acyltransferase like protein-like [Uloborus diversus]|uniref:O-acyltransferase like protein-like n=1 Tax=Uloborus diversus TaxID=327109 RepID=UPI0024092C77|nr:O-acyltransferase like protein-like [Uloborus diversus]
MKLMHLLLLLTFFAIASTENATTEESNLSLDETYGNFTSEEAELSLVDIEKKLKSFIGVIMQQAFPYVFRISTESRVSTYCMLDLAKVYFGFRRLEPWAFKLIDSAGKFSGGLLEGTTSALGDYDECLDISIGSKSTKLQPSRGEYCLLEIKPPEPLLRAIKDFQVNKKKSNYTLATTPSFLGFLRKVRTNPNHIVFRMGICMPSTCRRSDVQELLNTATKDIAFPVEVKRCEYKKDGFQFQPHQILIIIALCICVGIVLVGTAADFFCLKQDDGKKSISEDDLRNPEKVIGKKRTSKCLEVVAEFSINRSLKKLLDCSLDGDALDVVRGVKVLTIISMIFAHTYALPHPLHLYRFRDTLNFTKFIDNVLFGVIANSSVGVDTFFVLAGFLFVYYRWRLLKKPSGISYTGKFLNLIYVRMLAAQVLVISLFFLLPAFGSGPLWEEFVEEPLNNCRKTWWMNLLFIQNFLGPYDSCLYHTWILATIMQLFLITAIVLLILSRWPMIGIILSTLIICLGALGVTIVTIVYDFPATFTVYFYDYRTSIQLWKYLYVQFYTHIGPFCIGMLLAHNIAEYPVKQINKRTAILLWISALVTMCCIIFGLHHYRDGEEMERSLAIFYAALHRPAWAISIGWIIYACASDCGGIINSVLSWKVLIPLERLCYLAYLLHVPVMYYQGGIQRERMYMGHYNQVMSFFSYLVTSYGLAFIGYLLFQGPYEYIEGRIFGKGNDNIWKTHSATVSQETLEKTEEGTSPSKEETNSKVLYNRYVRKDSL